MRYFLFLGLVLRIGRLPAGCTNTTISFSHKLSAGIPSNLRPASEIIFDSVQLRGTVVRFLQVQPVGTNAWLSKTHNIPPDVDLESVKVTCLVGFLEKLNLHSDAVCPT